MINNHQVLGIIPARGGSKGVPRKNLKLLAGKPLLTYTIEEAKKSRYLDRLIIITDDQEIAALAVQLGADCPFLEPDRLAQGNVSDIEFFTYALNWLEQKENYRPEIIVQLRPTSPLRQVAEIDRAIEILASHPDADSVRTVIEPEQSPYKMYKIENNQLAPILPLAGAAESFNLPRQQLPQTYKHVGYVDTIWRRTIIEKKQISGNKIIPLILQEAWSGINTPQDFEFYELLIKKKNSRSHTPCHSRPLRQSSSEASESGNPPLIIHLVRHGHSLQQGHHNYEQNSSAPLSFFGNRQARAAAKKLVRLNIDLILASPMARAQETARIITSRVGRPLTFDERLIEHCPSRSATGKLFKELRNKTREDHNFAHHDGESLNQSVNRLLAVINECQKQSIKNVCLVSHALIIQNFLLKKFSLNQIPPIDEASITTIACQNGDFKIISLNKPCSYLLQLQKKLKEKLSFFQE